MPHTVFRTLIALLAVLSLALPAGPVAAANKKSEAPANPSVKDCRGTNILDELKITEPETFAQIESAAKVTENNNAMLWKIEREGIAPSYLFGTIHLTDPRVAELPATANSALRSASTVLLEIADLTPQSSANGLAQAIRLAIYTDGQSLESILTPEEYKKVQDTLARSGVPADAAKIFKPWIVTMLLAASDCERRKMQEGAPVLDMRIAEIAREKSTPVIGLETIDSQLNALASIAEDQQVQMLKSALVYADRTYDLVETTLQLR